MTGIGRDSDRQLNGLTIFYGAPCAQVIFHIAGPAQIIANDKVMPLNRVLKFGQDLGIGFVQNVG